MKILFILLTLFITGICQAEMLAIIGTVSCDNITTRDTIYDWVVNKSTSCWTKQSFEPIKTDYELHIDTPAHYDLYVEFRINNPNINKDVIKDYLQKLKLNNNVISLKIYVHKCNHDTGQSCTNQEYIIK